ncbi:MAG TPA: endonuclease domain-containing protein, partial [Rhizomicrobium sp.]|nr:endonuclease domain-containing protein [Rhizomicrobium sp.]
MRDSEPKTVCRARDLSKRMTDAETILWSRLRRDAADGFRFRRQHPIGPYIADFVCVRAKLVVEVDGDSHGSDEGVEYDRRRNAYMKARGWFVLRVWN